MIFGKLASMKPDLPLIDLSIKRSTDPTTTDNGSAGKEIG
jgi:hypothetical protein